SVPCLAASSDGKTIFAGSQEGTVNIWNSDGNLISKLVPPGSAALQASVPTPGEIAKVAIRGTAASKKKLQSPPATSDGSRRMPPLGEIMALTAAPEEIHLSDDSPRHGILITARTADGFELDATDRAQFSASPGAPFEIDERGTSRAVRPGQGVLNVRVG